MVICEMTVYLQGLFILNTVNYIWYVFYNPSLGSYGRLGNTWLRMTAWLMLLDTINERQSGNSFYRPINETREVGNRFMWSSTGIWSAAESS
jgi:hypothetical protein